LTVVKKRQAVPPWGAAFFFASQWLAGDSAHVSIEPEIRILRRSRNSNFSYGGFMSAFRFQRLLNISNDQTIGLAQGERVSKSFDEAGVIRTEKTDRERLSS
jgi:hypothetical protein